MGRKNRQRRLSKKTDGTQNGERSAEGASGKAAVMKCTACNRAVDSVTSISCPVIECGRIFCTDKCASTCIVTCGKSGCETRRCRPCATGKTWSLLHRRKVEVILGCSLRDFYRKEKNDLESYRLRIRDAAKVAQSSLTNDHRPFLFCKEPSGFGCNQSYCWDCSLHRCDHNDMAIGRLGQMKRGCPSCQVTQCSYCADEWCLDCDPHFDVNLQKCSQCLEDDEHLLSEAGPDIMHRLYRNRQCGGCLRSVTREGVITTKRCGGCKAVFYCDEICQARSWPVHREKCACLRDLRKEYNARIMERKEANDLRATKNSTTPRK